MGSTISITSETKVEDIANYIGTIGKDYEIFREKIISLDESEFKSIFSLDETEFNNLLEKIGIKEFTHKKVLWIQCKKYIMQNFTLMSSMETSSITTRNLCQDSIMEPTAIMITNTISQDSESSIEPNKKVLTKKIITKNSSINLKQSINNNQPLIPSKNSLQGNNVNFENVLIEAKNRLILSNGEIVNLRENPKLLVGIPGIEELSVQDKSQILKLCVISFMYWDERLFEVSKTRAYCSNSVDSLYMKSCMMNKINIKSTGELTLNNFAHFHCPTCTELSFEDLKVKILEYSSKNNFQLPDNIQFSTIKNNIKDKPSLKSLIAISKPNSIEVNDPANVKNKEIDSPSPRRKVPNKAVLRRYKNGKLSVYRSMTDAAKLFGNETFRHRIAKCCEATINGEELLYEDCIWEYCTLKFYEDGSEYFGEMKNEKRHGYGKYVDIDGSSFEGDWDYDKKRRGLEIFIDRSTFEGDYNNNERVNGIFKYENGDVYQGYWLNGMKHGQGKMDYANEDYYKGNWANDLYEDFGIHKTEAGIYSGEHKNGKRCGNCKFNYPAGNQFIGEWSDDIVSRKDPAIPSIKEIKENISVRSDDIISSKDLSIPSTKKTKKEKTQTIPVIQLDLEGNHIDIFNSNIMASNKVYENASDAKNIVKCCDGEISEFKGFKWKKAGSIESDGTFDSYIGEAENGNPHGYGKMCSNAGNYIGNFKAGQKSGKGMCLFPDGSTISIQDGVWDNNSNFLSGYCNFVKKDGETYVGETKNGMYDGKGKLIKSDTVYEGTFKEDKFVDGEVKVNGVVIEAKKKNPKRSRETLESNRTDDDFSDDIRDSTSNSNIDWICNICNFKNRPFRKSCFNSSCSSSRPLRDGDEEASKISQFLKEKLRLMIANKELSNRGISARFNEISYSSNNCDRKNALTLIKKYYNSTSLFLDECEKEGFIYKNLNCKQYDGVIRVFSVGLKVNNYSTNNDDDDDDWICSCGSFNISSKLQICSLIKCGRSREVKRVSDKSNLLPKSRRSRSRSRSRSRDRFVRRQSTSEERGRSRSRSYSRDRSDRRQLSNKERGRSRSRSYSRDRSDRRQLSNKERGRSRSRSYSRDRSDRRQLSIKERGRSRSRSRSRSYSRDRSDRRQLSNKDFNKKGGSESRERQTEKQKEKNHSSRSRSKEKVNSRDRALQVNQPLISSSGDSKFMISKVITGDSTNQMAPEFNFFGLVPSGSPLQQLLSETVVIKGKSKPGELNTFISGKETNCFRLYADKISANFDAFRVKNIAWYALSGDFKCFLIPKALRYQFPILQSLGDLKDDTTNELLFFGIVIMPSSKRSLSETKEKAYSLNSNITKSSDQIVKSQPPLTKVSPTESLQESKEIKHSSSSSITKPSDPRVRPADPRVRPTDPRVKPQIIEVLPNEEIEQHYFIQTVSSDPSAITKPIEVSPSKEETITTDLSLETLKEKEDGEITEDNIEICVNYLRHGTCKFGSKCRRYHCTAEQKIKLFNKAAYRKLSSKGTWMDLNELGDLFNAYYIDEKISNILAKDSRFKFKKGKANAVFVKIESSVRVKVSDSSSDDRYNIPCKYAKLPGGCKSDECRYLHEGGDKDANLTESKEDNIEICQNYLKRGECRFGNECKRRHINTEDKIKLITQEVYKTLSLSGTWTKLSEFGNLLKTYYIDEKISSILSKDSRFKFKRNEDVLLIKVDKRFDVPCKFAKLKGGCKNDDCKYLHDTGNSKSREKSVSRSRSNSLDRKRNRIRSRSNSLDRRRKRNRSRSPCDRVRKRSPSPFSLELKKSFVQDIYDFLLKDSLNEWKNLGVLGKFVIKYNLAGKNPVKILENDDRFEFRDSKSCKQQQLRISSLHFKSK